MSDLVAEFCAITGASASEASSLLSVCNDSLEMAINMHMERTSGNNVEPGPSCSSSSSSSGSEDSVRAPIPQKTDTLIEPGYEGYALQKGNPHKARVRSVFDGFRNFNNESQDDTRLPVSRKKKRTLEELFKPPVELTHKEDFQSARDSATAANKWLLVNVQDAGEFQCHILNRDVWSNVAVKSILREHFIFWQQYKESEEAQRYMTFYPVTKWPYVAILDPRTGEKLVEWNKIDSSIFCDLVSEFLSMHRTLDSSNDVQPPKKKLKSEEEEFCVIDANEDDQIAMAIKASLESHSNSPKNIDSDSESDLVFEEDEDSNLSISSPVKRVSETKGTFKRPPNTSNSSSLVATNSKELDTKTECSEQKWENYLGNKEDPVASIMFRFPDGERESQKFPSTSKLLAIILYIKSKGYSLDTHEIVTNFPRRIISELDHQNTLSEHGIFPQETLFVQKR